MQRCRRKEAIVRFPRQFLSHKERLLRALRRGEEARHAIKMVEDEVVEEELPLCADVEEGNFIAG